MMTKYAKITARFPAVGGGTVRRTVTISLDKDTASGISGFLVNKEGERVTIKGAESYFVIGSADIIKRIDLRMNLHYGELEPINGQMRTQSEGTGRA